VLAKANTAIAFAFNALTLLPMQGVGDRIQAVTRRRRAESLQIID
jgi:hypothetical protein